MPDYAFDIRKKMRNEEFKRKFCNESSALPFDVDRKLEDSVANEHDKARKQNYLYFIVIVVLNLRYENNFP